MIIFDSTFLIDLMKNPNNAKQNNCKLLLDEIKVGGEPFATTFVNVLELNKGIYKSNTKERTEELLNTILRIIPVLDFSNEYYAQYGKLSAFLEMKGTPIGMFD